MDPLIGYGIVSGIGSLASSLFNQFTGQSMSKDLMKYQAELNQQAIDRQNQYNTPANQVKRLAEAQLNPNLVYGSGVDGNQSSAASVGLANRHGSMQNPLQDMGQAYLQGKQLDMERIRLRNDAFESRERQLKLRAETLGQLLDNQYNDQTMKDRVKIKSQELINKMSENDRMQAQINQYHIVANNLIEEGNLLAARTRLTGEQALTEVVKRQAMHVGMALDRQRINQLTSLIKWIDAGTGLREQEGEVKGYHFDLEKIYNDWKLKHPGAALTLDAVRQFLDYAKGAAAAAAPFL